jgi:hypothetical protein
MSAKHTPGPWQIYPAPYPLIETADGIAVAKTDCSLSRVSGKWVENREMLAANAALISAAPDLLAALEELLVERYALEEPEEFDADGRWTSSSPASVKARAAIAKAKGEA